MTEIIAARIDLVAVAIATELGKMVAVVGDDPAAAIVRLDFVTSQDEVGGPEWFGLPVDWRRTTGTDFVAREITAYMAGQRQAFDLPIAPLGGGEFDREVWRSLQRLVPFGTTATYGEIAARLNRPGAARAVGHANALNPISVIVPCHRVVGANGKLVGYGGGQGVATKRSLLELEARHMPPREGFLL